MKIITLLYLFLFTFSLCSAQHIDFTLANPQPDLIEVYGGSFASGDIDGDGDQDLLMAGQNPGRDTALYLNDGSGDFMEVVNTPFPEASSSVTIFEDLDADGDLDLYFSGTGSSIGAFAHIYLNDGFGVFTQLSNPLIPEFQGRGAAIQDVDNDGDSDLIISAEDTNSVFIADVFLNDGDANFTPSGNTGFTPVEFASVAFIDVESDGDADVLISGNQANGDSLTALYLNDGLGNFSVDVGVNFVQISADDIDVADIDNDGDFDILMSGSGAALGVRTMLYINDGNCQFTEVTTNLQQTFAGTNAIVDFDNDGDQDIVIIGSQAGGLPNIFNIVYENLGNNEFEPVITLGGEYIAACVVNDFNGDDLVDIIIQGFVDKTNVYWNNSEILGTPDVFAEDQRIVMYPNPTNTLVHINASEVIDSITLFTVLGQEVLSFPVNSEHLQLDMSNYAAGNYILKLQSQGNTENLQLIKI